MGSKKIIAGFIFITVVSFAIGIIIGNFGIKKPKSIFETYYDELIEVKDEKTALDLLNKELKSDNMKNHLKYLTSIGHMAGTPGDNLSAEYVYNQWKDQGLDEFQKLDYNILLDFPDNDKFNNVEILNGDLSRDIVYEIKETTYDKDLNYSVIPKPFLAYAKSGSVNSSTLYFVNYCLEEDFEHLKSKGISVAGSIVICKYGKVFRGNKIQVADIYGASGVILFDDPARAAPKIAQNYIYPSGEFLPNEGTQRGSLYLRNGDVHTFNYPSNDYAYRNISNEYILPNIPAQVVGYGVAYNLFKLIEKNGNQVDPSWKGEFNLTYTYGGSLDNGKKIVLNVFNQRRVEKTYNVIGIIKGSIEPDRYVIIGNHRDAWSFGALDPTSGTSVMLEVSRALMAMKKSQKWKPKRSILFMSWGAEEYGLIGSFEWVEEFQKKLKANAVAYFNLDTIISGNYSYEAAASPLLYDFVFNVTRSIPISANLAETVYDRWLKNDPNQDNSEPYISPYLGAGSDHAAFAQIVGLPCVDQSFVRNKNNPLFVNFGTGSYPTYHSSYETFNLVSNFLDPTFETFRTIGLITGELIRRLSDSLILPFNAIRYAQVLNKEYSQFKSKYSNDFTALNINLKNLDAAVNDFNSNSVEFHKRVDALDKTQYYLIRKYNDQLRNLERAFLDTPVGLNRNGYEHILFAPSIFNNYGGDLFPGLEDAIYNYKKNSLNNNLKYVEDIKFQLSVVTFVIRSASSILREPFDFTR